MRTIFCAVILFATGCSGQQANTEQPKVDTTKLFNPFPEPPSAKDILMFKNSIVLFHPNFTVIQNETEHSFDNFKEVTDFFAKNVNTIGQQKFYLLIDSSTKFDKVISIIDALKKIKIGNYRVINCQEYFKPPDPIIIQAPTVTTTTRKLYDSTYFSITIENNRFKLKIHNENADVKTNEELDKFIERNKVLIDSDKIQIISDVNVPFEKFKLVSEVLRKHEYNKFSLINK